MKKLLLIYIVTFTFIPLLLNACSSGDDGDDEILIKDNKVGNSPFVGYWKIHSNAGYYANIFFFQDGKCRYEESDKVNKIYSWTYDPTTQFLSITGRSDLQLQIKSIDNKSWSALDMGNSGYGVSAEEIVMKGEARKWLDYLLEYEKNWVSKDAKNADFNNASIVGCYLSTNIPYTYRHDGQLIKANYSSGGLFYQSKDGWVTSEKGYITESDVVWCNRIDWNGSYTKSNRKENKKITIEFHNIYSYNAIYMNVNVQIDGETLINEKFYPKRPFSI